MNTQIRYGWSPTLRTIIHITEAERGLQCGCICVECGGQLEAVKGGIREHYFRHREINSCFGGPETGVHIRAKQIIAENTKIKIPGRQLLYSNVRVENVLDGKKPDVTVTANGEDVHFEIRVTNPVQKEKKAFYCNGKHKCIEIDLSDTKWQTAPPEDLKKYVLEETLNKYIIYWESQKQRNFKQENSLIEKIFGMVLFTIVILFFFKLFAVKKRY